MKILLVAICLASVGCYTIGAGPTARGDARRVSYVELVSSAVVILAGAKAQHDSDVGEDGPPDNVGALILLSGGILLGIAGLVSYANSD
jgi:hypothetical protein